MEREGLQLQFLQQVHRVIVFHAFDPKSLQFLPTTMQKHFTLLKGPFHSFHATFCSGNFTANVAECLKTLKKLIKDT